MNSLTLMPPTPSFTPALVGGTSSASLLVTNDGSGEVTAVTASIDGADASGFSLDPDGCSGHDLNGGSSCTLLVKFHPTHAGLSTASLTIMGGGARAGMTILTATATGSLMVTVIGPGSGTIVSDPPGISCTSGTCSHDFDVPSVRLMATPDPSSGLLEWSGSGCSGDGACVVSLDAGVRLVQAMFTKIICVNATTGEDSHSGDCSAPLKSITKAMTLASTGYTVQLAPGTYGDQYTGETMPISVPVGVRLIGDEPAKGAGIPFTTIRGEGFVANNDYATVRPSSGATVAGLILQPSSTSQHWVDLIYLDASSTGVLIRNNSIVGGAVGILVEGKNHVISDNNIHDQREINQSFPSGSAIRATDSTAKVERNVLTAGLYGVVMDGGVAALDLGGGALSSTGNNAIYCNSRVNVVVTTDDTVFATNNAWDHSPLKVQRPPVIGCLAGPGLDFCGAMLVTAPASIAGGACP